MRAALSKLSAVSCLFVLVAAAPARAQDKSDPKSASEAARIISQYIKAAGGSHVLSRVRTISLQGTVAPSGESASGSFTLDAKSPNRYYSELNIAGKHLIEAYNGKSAWHLDASSSPATMFGADSQQMLIESQVAGSHLIELKKNAVSAHLVGHATVQGKDALQVELTSPFGAKRELFFDPDSHLLIEDSGSVAGVAEQVFYSNYSPESRVQVPHRLEIHRGSDVFSVTVTTVEVNGRIGERVFDVPLSSQVKLPDLKALFKEIDQNQKAIDKLQDQYGGIQVEEEVEYGSGDKVKSHKTTESKFFHYNDDEISIVLKRDGKPLSDAEEKLENDNARNRVEELRKRHAEEEAKKAKDKAAGKDAKEEDADKDKDSDGHDTDVGIEMFLRIAQFVNPRRERFRGRDVLVFDFEANPEYKAHGLAEKIVQKLAGTIWIDEEAHDVVRLEAFFAKEERLLGGLLASVHRGTAFVFEQEYVNNEVWLPTYEEAYYGARVLLLIGFRGSYTTRYSDYAKFDADAAYPPAAPTPSAPTKSQ